MKKIINCIFLGLIICVLLANICLGFWQGFLTNFYYYLFTGSLYIILPFLCLFYILICEAKMLHYKKITYVEIYLAILILAGSVLIYLFAKLELDISLLIWFLISGLVFLVLVISFKIFSLKSKNSAGNGPKIIANR